MSAEEKFLKYVSYDTQSDPESPTAPSSAKQLILAEELVKELKAIGVENAEIGKGGIVYGSVEANGDVDIPAIGLIAHMDTAGEMSGKDVHSRKVENYDGGTIQLNDTYSMDPTQFPALAGVVGDDLIVTDGTTLLGGDDKAGIAIIMQAVENIIADGRKHGKILVAFTPDEEIGRGVENFDLDRFPADFAYTLDGGDIHGVDYETFNAAAAVVRFKGLAIHPGSAKDKMINAAIAAVEYASLLPAWERPEHTEGREGFFHLLEMSGDCENAKLSYIIRDHDHDHFEKRKEMMNSALTLINERYPDCATLEIHDSYYNLKDFMKGDFRSVDRAKQALEQHGLTPVSIPVRGGTDGAQLSARGLITPNLGTGDGNCHGRFEFVSVTQMDKMVGIVETILGEMN